MTGPSTSEYLNVPWGGGELHCYRGYGSCTPVGIQVTLSYK